MYFDTHERILQKLAETGQNEFSTDMIKEAIGKGEDEEIDSMYQDYLKSEAAHAEERAQWRADEITLDRIERSQYEAAQPTSWEEAAEGLEGIPPREHSQGMEMER